MESTGIAESYKEKLESLQCASSRVQVQNQVWVQVVESVML